MIRVFLADDHPLVREGLHRIVRGDALFRVVGEADDGESLLRQLETIQVDVLLLDISMPGPGFPELMGQIRRRFPELRVLVVSMHPEAYYAERAIRIGASGYVSKRQSVDELTRAIVRVHAGEVYVSTPPDGGAAGNPPGRSSVSVSSSPATATSGLSSRGASSAAAVIVRRRLFNVSRFGPVLPGETSMRAVPEKRCDAGSRLSAIS